ncbi:MAG: DJ-1/PfpI family protein [Candidatus Odinarchaeota archaeon]|nr:DJ-1/PfpI family protein [Candidatus Odinarchaeota archaeon]
MKKGLVLATICHGPLVLAKAGVIDEIKVTAPF